MSYFIYFFVFLLSVPAYSKNHFCINGDGNLKLSIKTKNFNYKFSSQYYPFFEIQGIGGSNFEIKFNDLSNSHKINFFWSKKKTVLFGDYSKTPLFNPNVLPKSELDVVGPLIDEWINLIATILNPNQLPKNPKTGSSSITINKNLDQIWVQKKYQKLRFYSSILINRRLIVMSLSNEKSNEVVISIVLHFEKCNQEITV